MKKIPTLFERVFDNHHKVGINNKVQLLTLSACEYTYANGRFVVVAKKV